MAKEIVYLQGKCKWARLVRPDTTYDQAGIWSIVLYPNPESLVKIKELKEDKEGRQGILNHLKMDEDGQYMAFKRSCQKMIKGKLQPFHPPIVLEADGKTPIANPGAVGNGSDVTIKIEVYGYTTKGGNKGTATRLESIKVDNLVEFEPKRDFPEDMQKQIKGLAEQPVQGF